VNRKLNTLVVWCILSLISTACSGSTNTDLAGSDKSDLPVALVAASTAPIKSLSDLDDASDAILRVKLVGVKDGFRFPVDKEGDRSTSIEHVGLVFDVVEIFLGKIDESRITVDYPGYQIASESKDRKARLQVGQFDFTDENALGRDYVIGVVFAEDIGFRMLSSSFVRIESDSKLVSVVGTSLHGIGIETLDQLEAASSELVSSG